MEVCLDWQMNKLNKTVLNKHTQIMIPHFGFLRKRVPIITVRLK